MTLWTWISFPKMKRRCGLSGMRMLHAAVTFFLKAQPESLYVEFLCLNFSGQRYGSGVSYFPGKTSQLIFKPRDNLQFEIVRP